MEPSEILDFSNRLSQQGVLLCFNGPFSSALIQEFGQALRKHLSSAAPEGASTSAVMDVFSVYVEQAQNIQRYADRRGVGASSDEGVYHGIVMIARMGGRFAVCSGNRVRAADGEALRERLEKVRAADKAALKAMYKQQLRAAPGEHGGAGLGFISMARVAAAPIEYLLQPVGEDEVFFSLRVLI